MLSVRSKKQTEILKAAAKLFLDRGYDAVALDDILERVGGSKTTLYSYYGCKEGLFAATVERMCHDRLRPLLALNVADLDPEEGLTQIGRQFLLILSDPQGHSLFRIIISEAQRFPELASGFFQAGPQAVIKTLRQSIANWQHKGLLRGGNPEVFAVQFLGLIMGNFQIKTLLGLMKPLTEKQRKLWVTRGVELFLKGAVER